jgi:hypothetical protein
MLRWCVACPLHTTHQAVFVQRTLRRCSATHPTAMLLAQRGVVAALTGSCGRQHCRMRSSTPCNAAPTLGNPRTLVRVRCVQTTVLCACIHAGILQQHMAHLLRTCTTPSPAHMHAHIVIQARSRPRARAAVAACAHAATAPRFAQASGPGAFRTLPVMNIPLGQSPNDPSMPLELQMEVLVPESERAHGAAAAPATAARRASRITHALACAHRRRVMLLPAQPTPPRQWWSSRPGSCSTRASIARMLPGWRAGAAQVGVCLCVVLFWCVCVCRASCVWSMCTHACTHACMHACGAFVLRCPALRCVARAASPPPKRTHPPTQNTRSRAVGPV